nr:MAG TPA: hypothetical protein [Caudoviricetes sp.]
MGFCRTAETVRLKRCVTPLCRRDIPGPDFIPETSRRRGALCAQTAGPTGCTAHNLRATPLKSVF